MRNDAQESPYRGDDSSPAHSSSLSFVGDAISRDTTWPVGVKLGLFIVASILILNASVTLWATTTSPVRDGIGTLHAGDCSRLSKASTGLQILVNVIATMLLGVGSYCMQCLTSPTREDISREHKAKRWLDIGIMSFRNLRKMTLRRISLFSLLGLSVLPIHLLYVAFPFSDPRNYYKPLLAIVLTGWDRSNAAMFMTLEYVSLSVLCRILPV
jgi:hypothetical protein